MSEAEQWKQGGDCVKCRRHPYCKKVCTERKRYFSAKLKEMLRERMKELAEKEAPAEEHLEN